MNEKLVWIFFWLLAASLLLASIVLTFIAYALQVPDNSSSILEATKIFCLCLGGSGVVLSTYFTGMNMFLQRQTAIIENTFALLSRWDDPHYLEARKWTRKAKEEKADTSDNELIDKIKADEELKQSVVLVMNYLEHVRFSLGTKRIDKDLFKRALGDTLIDIAKRFETYGKTVNEQISEDLKELIKKLDS